MIRKGILVALTIGGLLVALAWATSFYAYDHLRDSPSRLHSFLRYTNEKRTCYYVTSLRGWLRIGTVRKKGPFGRLPEPDDRDTWIWLGSRTWPSPGLAETPLGTAHLGGLVVVGKFSFDSGLIAGFAAPHSFISLLLLAYPTVACIRGPLRRRHRRKRGLCPSCGYDLTGNTTGVCPECAGKVIAP